MLVVASLGVGCEGEPRLPQEYCEVDTVRGKPIECCRLCPVLAGLEDHDCELPAPPSAFRGIAATWEDWKTMCEGARVFSGRCSNGLRYLGWDSGLGGAEMRYFDASGAFVALETFSDLIDEACVGNWYWPRAVDCSGRTGSTLCGPAIETL